MPAEWHTYVGWVVTLFSGLALQWVNRTADRYSHTPIGRFFLARDPPRLPPRGTQRVVVTDDQLRLITEAVMEGQRPLVEATQALQADVATAVALLSGDPTTANIAEEGAHQTWTLFLKSTQSTLEEKECEKQRHAQDTYLQVTCEACTMYDSPYFLARYILPQEAKLSAIMDSGG
ncbi:MAG: hypothetical protein Q9218_007125 [Villophora microphyllina]